VRGHLDAHPHPELDGFYWVVRGMWRSFEGRFEDCLEPLDRGLDLLRTRCAGGAFETTIGEQAVGIARVELGRLGELRRTATEAAERAADRGNFYREAFAAAFLSHVALADDDPEAARSLVAPTRARQSKDLFHQQHWLILATELRADLYEGKLDDALARWDAAWPEVSKSYLLYLKESAVRVRRLGGRLLAAAGRDKEAWAMAKALEKASWPSARGSAAIVRAVLARDDLRGATGELAVAGDFFDLAGMHVDAAAVRLTRSELLGEPGEPPSSRLRQLGVAAPSRWAAMVVPGLRGAGTTDRAMDP